MIEFQKMIKYLAIAFGIFLIITITSSIIFGITAIFGVTMKLGDSHENSVSIGAEFVKEYQNLKELDIQTEISKLTIKQGETYKVEAKNVSDKFYCEQQGDKLVIIGNEKHSYFMSDVQDNTEIIISLPESATLESVNIATGISETMIKDLKTNKLKIDFGVGSTIMERIQAEKVDFNTGAGSVEMKESKLKDLELDAGIGQFIYSGSLTGNSVLKGGVGEQILNLKETSKEYKIKASTGIGEIKVDRKNLTDGEEYGEGNNRIKVDGGIGRIEINFNR